MNKRHEIAPFTPLEKTADSANCWKMKFSNGVNRDRTTVLSRAESE